MTNGKSFPVFHNTVLNFVFVLLLAFLVSTALFIGMSSASESYIARYVRDDESARREMSQIIDSLESYISVNGIASDAIDNLLYWSKKQKYMHLIVFRQDEIIFDSDAAIGIPPTAGIQYTPNFSVSLTDGIVPIYLNSFYEYRYSEIAIFAEMVLSFLVFTSIIVFFVARHLTYIREISFAVEAMEGGNLACEIPVRGGGELSSLAGSLNEMRKAFQLKNCTLPDDVSRFTTDLAAISHDLRTPLTTLILFIEIIKKKKNMTEDERDYYIQKLSVIAGKIKVLSENLEDFTSSDFQFPVALDEPRTVGDILQNVLPDSILFLEERGFRVEKPDLASDALVRVNNHFIFRIMDNIVSNIDRYASREESVIIRETREGNTVSLLFINTVAETIPPLETSKLGISLVKEMMSKMHGTCGITKRSNDFILKLTFPLVLS